MNSKFRAWNIAREIYDINMLLTPDGELLYIDEWGDLEAVRESWCLIEHCTGLKDKNGKEIFEGDIIRWSIGEGCARIIYEIVFVNGWCGKWTGRFSKGGITPLHLTEEYSEVIGNIHENPELLEVTE